MAPPARAPVAGGAVWALSAELAVAEIPAPRVTRAAPPAPA